MTTNERMILAVLALLVVFSFAWPMARGESELAAKVEHLESELLQLKAATLTNTVTIIQGERAGSDEEEGETITTPMTADEVRGLLQFASMHEQSKAIVKDIDLWRAKRNKLHTTQQ